MNTLRARQQLYALLFIIVSFLALAGSSADAAVPPRPAQREYVVDAAGMIRPGDAERIRQIGTELREKTKAELVVVTVDTLDGTDIESYANELFRSWGIGDAKQSNGVLLLIAKDDRQFRIEVGYGLEGEITDGRAGEILDKMKPYFRDEKYSEGVLNAYQKLAACAYRAAGVAPGADVSETLEEASSHKEEEPSILMNVLIFFLAIIGMIVLGVILNWLLGILNQALGSDRGGSSRRDRDFSNDRSSRSSSSSSGSSRGGYGGGSSGGGGASGGW